VRRFIALVLLALLGLPAGASAATLGEQRVLLILTTWGPEPYTPAAIRAELDEAAAYMRTASFGKTWLTGDVTPWLRALASKPGCDTAAIAQAAQSAAQAAGYDLARYTTVGIAMAHLDACPWGGAYFPPGIWLNGRHDRHVIAHELGHTYGVSEEGSAWICDPGCHAQPYMNPFSVMGHGWSDYGAWEKHEFGWLDQVAEPASRLTLGAIDRPSTRPQGAAGARRRRRVLVRVSTSGAGLGVRVGRRRTRRGDSRGLERSRRAEPVLGPQLPALRPGGAQASVGPVR
jgi:hypothetical protein